MDFPFPGPFVPVRTNDESSPATADEEKQIAANKLRSRMRDTRWENGRPPVYGQRTRVERTNCPTQVPAFLFRFGTVDVGTGIGVGFRRKPMRYFPNVKMQ